MSGHCTLSAAVLSALAWRHTTADADMDGLHRADTAEAAYKHVRTLAHVWSSLATTRPSPSHADEVAQALAATEHALAAEIAGSRSARSLRAAALRAIRALPLDAPGGAT